MTDIPEGALPDRCPECGRPPYQMYQIGETDALWCRQQHRWVVPTFTAIVRAILAHEGELV